MAVEKEFVLLSSSNFSLILITTAAVLYFVHWYFSRRHVINLSKNIPGPPGLPVLGNAWDMRGSSHSIFSFFDNCSKNYRKIWRVWIGPRLVVFLKRPEDIELVLSSNVHLDKSPEYDALRPWLGNGLLTSTGDIWRTHRKIIAPSFHINILRSFVDLINKNSRITIEKLKQFGTNEFDCHEYMCEATVDILLETVMGVRNKNVTAPNEPLDYARSVMTLNDILHMRHFKPWLKPQFIFDLTSYSKSQFNLLGIVHGLSRKIINYKKQEFKDIKNEKEALLKEEIVTPVNNFKNGAANGVKSGKYMDDLDAQDDMMSDRKRKPFLDTLIDNLKVAKDISEQEVKEQVDTILFEGHDTTGAGSSFFLTMMGIHQDVQQKIVNELYDIFGDSDRPATFADTNEMKYLERCILETFRLYPPVPIIARELRQDLKLMSGDYTIPAGCTVVIGTYWLHHDPEIFPDPYTFNPDHHLPEKTAGRNNYAYIPFSAGPRSCVGRKYAMLKLKILLSTILRNYKIFCDAKEADFKLQADIILKRVEGFKIKLEPRTVMAATKV